MKAVYIAQRGKIKKKRVLDGNYLGKGKFYDTPLEAREEFEKMKKLDKRRKYKIIVILSNEESQPKPKKEKKLEKMKPKYRTERIMGMPVKERKDE